MIYSRPNLLNQFRTLYCNSSLRLCGLCQKQGQVAAIYRHRLRAVCCLAYGNALGFTSNFDHFFDYNQSNCLCVSCCRLVPNSIQAKIESFYLSRSMLFKRSVGLNVCRLFVTPSPLSPSPCQGEGEFIIKEGLMPLLDAPVKIRGGNTILL